MLYLVPLPVTGRVSYDAEAFAEHLKRFHEQVRTALERSTQKYKKAADAHRREKMF